MLKKFFWKTSVVFLTVVLLVISVLPTSMVSASTYTISKSTYYDKTLAGTLGQVAGLLSGYEFVTSGGAPYIALPDDWFDLCNGPYAGNFLHAGDPAYPGYDRLWSNGVVGSDDDYHIDFFNQHILDVHGPNVTSQDIKDEWMEHNVHDWGAGFVAMALMKNPGLLLPFTGMREFGNRYYWCTEAYIENDTLGMAAPGMPDTASKLAEKFGSVTGDFDSLTWAKFLSAMYSLAYTETTAVNVVDKAAVVIPQNSWPYSVYQTCKQLYQQNPTDWRWAVNQLVSIRRNVHESDNVMTLTDVNNGFTILALLYGNNDYLTTCKIASLAGYDGDCNAATATGIMGVLKGMSGTPQSVKDYIYVNGTGKYIDDIQTGFDPYIKLNYPRSQTFDEIAATYQRNAEDQITANGGTIDSANYYINQQTAAAPNVVLISNYDFENGSLNGWSKWTPVTDTTHIVSENSTYAHSGNWDGKITTDSTVNEGKLYVQLSGLESGSTYKVKAFLKCAAGKEARLYAENYGGSYIYTSVYSNPDFWVDRTLEFTVTGTSAQVGLHLPVGGSGSLWGCIDNLYVEKVINGTTARYEAESAATGGAATSSSSTASNGQYRSSLDGTGDYLQFTINASSTGEYLIKINYANGNTYNTAQKLYINGNLKASVMYPRTGAYGTFSRNIVAVPVELTSGNNMVKLEKYMNYVDIDYIDAVYMNPATIETAAAGILMLDTTNHVLNNSFEADGATQTPSNWSTWPGNSGYDADADYTETGGYSGTYRLTHYKASNYEVYTSQTITGLSNGYYTLRAWVISGGGQSKLYMDAKNTGSPDQKYNIDAWGWPDWTQIEIPGIQVVNGQCTVGFYSLGNAGNWFSVDSYEVYTSQNLTNLENGSYTLRAWVVSGGGQISNYLDVKNYGGTARTANIPANGWPNWIQVSITGISVTNGQCTVGMYSNANANNWCSLDDIEFFKE